MPEKTHAAPADSSSANPYEAVAVSGHAADRGAESRIGLSFTLAISGLTLFLVIAAQSFLNRVALEFELTLPVTAAWCLSRVVPALIGLSMMIAVAKQPFVRSRKARHTWHLGLAGFCVLLAVGVLAAVGWSLLRLWVALS